MLLPHRISPSTAFLERLQGGILGFRDTEVLPRLFVGEAFSFGVVSDISLSLAERGSVLSWREERRCEAIDF
jgi:hypothetical protein